VIIHEEDRNTPYREVAFNELRKYCDGKHTFEMFDPDDKDGSTKQTPVRLRAWLNLVDAEGATLPVMIVVADDDDGEVAQVVDFPSSGSSVDTGQAAGQKAIAALKELGG
jgi:hypothetical protein